MPGYLHLRMEFSAFFPAVFAEPVIPDIVIAPLLDLDQLRQFLSSLIIAAYHEINCHIRCRKLVFQHDDARCRAGTEACRNFSVSVQDPAMRGSGCRCCQDIAMPAPPRSVHPKFRHTGTPVPS